MKRAHLAVLPHVISVNFHRTIRSFGRSHACHHRDACVQVNRLCNMPTEVCELALRALTRSGFLQVSGDSFLRLGRRQPRRAVVA